MKLFTSLVLLMCFVVVTNAQVNTNINASATVNDQLLLAKNVDVQFGEVQKNTGTPVYLDPNDAASTNVATSSKVGKFTITGSDKAITVIWPANASLSDGVSHTLTYTTKVVGDASSGNQAGATVLATPAGTNVTLASSSYTLWVGGYLGVVGTGIANSQVNGTYQANLQFTIEYN